ncbi:uncharacterized protein LOC117177101 [Belonocnema kinseyi]|uniref:uncharacterized protein LOC117177101 n=1 Tax=Belonocnema kinseyi TaxID=2817044 RepID=UPI00143D3121|nr:uncharacterized protein LOC117177101 [Belonocnema kinseyi]
MRQSAIISVFLTYVVLCSLIVITTVKADVLSPNQKAPPFARGSGAYALPLPREGKPSVIQQPVKQPAGNAENGVQREDVTSFKKVGDETILVVEGSLGYKSPEGLAISVNYKADENGNHASFKFGTGLPGSSPSRGSQPVGGGDNKGGVKGANTKSTGGGSGPSSFLPPGQKGKTEERSYLPPS